MNITHIKTTVLPLILVSLLLAIQGIMAQSQQPLYGGTLRIAYTRDPISLNGILNYWSTTGGMSTQIYGGLLTYTKDYSIVGDLAKSWTSSPDGKTWTFKLRDDVYWSDGVKFTSADVKWHYEKLKEYTTPVSGFLVNLKSIDTPDDYTVIFRFDSLSTAIPFGLGQCDANILPKHIYEKGDFKTNPANLKPVGTGPYIVSEWVKDSYIVMVPNPKWYGGRPYLDKLIFRFISQPATALIALEAGEVDQVHEMPGIPLQEVGRLKNHPTLAVDVYSYCNSWRIAFNFRDEAVAKNPWIKDVRVRQAISYAIDRKTIVDKVLYGVVTELYGPLSPLVTDYYNPNIAKYEYDPVKAEKLLDEAGYKPGPDGVRFKAKFPAYETGKDIAEVIKQIMKRVGIDLEVMLVENTAFYQMYELSEKGLQDLPMCLNRMSAGPDPEKLRESLYGNRMYGVQNVGFYSNARVDELFDKGMATTDYATRKAAFDEIQMIVTKDITHVHLFHNWKIQAYNKEFQGFENIRPMASFSNYASAKIYWTKGQSLATTTTLATPKTTVTSPQPTVDTSTTVLVAVGVLVLAAVVAYAWKRKRK
jgi:peptide/nickel transport system substrate-binding protein